MAKISSREALRRLAAIPFAGSIPASGLVSAEYPNWRNETFEYKRPTVLVAESTPSTARSGIAYYIQRETHDRLAKVLKDAEEA